MDPVNGDSFSIMGDEEFPSASLVKLGVMVDAFARVREGSLSLNDPLTLLALDQTGGSGVLQFLSTPRELTIWDAVFLMVTLSDNTATNLLLEKLRPRQVTERMRSLGLEHTRIFLPVNANAGESFDPEASRAFGLGVTTPVEIAALLTMLYRGELVDAEASEKMLGIMTRQFYREGIPRELPPEVAVAHKTGSLDRARNDCGVVYGPSRDFVICVMTKENEDQTWTYDNEAERLIAAISREVYEALNPETGRVGDGVTRHPVPGSGYR
ncbi:MAG: class A beta-lactamase-related serine hydrolase [Gemmatimonadota bacterium]|nr:class A beta-lactamase-related serine hydrolase [Gemmatimonadota bacterium]